MTMNMDDELSDAIKLLAKTKKQFNEISHTDTIFGSDYYNTVNDIGVSDWKKSVGSPTDNSINRYYDEKKNYSILAPTLDPLNIYQLTHRVKQSIQENDYSESYFFSSTFDRDEITSRFLEKNIIYSKRLEWMRINDIKRMQKSEQLLAINLLILDKLDNILRYHTKQYILDKYESNPIGKAFYLSTTLVGNASTSKIDFTDSNKCLNLPDGFRPSNFPNTELFSLVVKVDSGGPVFLGINEPEGKLDAYVQMNLNEEYKVENPRALIKSLNMYSTVNSNIRVIGMF